MLLFIAKNLYIQVWQLFVQCSVTDLHAHYLDQSTPSQHHTLLEISLVFTSLV